MYANYENWKLVCYGWKMRPRKREREGGGANISIRDMTKWKVPQAMQKI